MLKLRKLLLKQLPDDWQKIQQLHHNKEWQALDASLHKLLGSAKICAASLLIQQIEILKNSIAEKQSNAMALQHLKSAIEQTIQASAVNPE